MTPVGQPEAPRAVLILARASARQAEALAQKHGATGSYDSAETLIASPNVDAVCLRWRPGPCIY